MTRKFSSISVNTTLATGISSSATTMTVATGTASLLLGGATLTAGNVDQFTVAIDPDTVNEEIVFVTNVSSDTLTIVRGRAGSSAITHSGGATVKHVLTGNDLDYFTSVADSALTPSSTSTVTNKDLTSGTNTFPTSLATLTGTQTLTNKDLSSGTNTFSTSIATLTGTQAFTNKDLTSGTNTFPTTLATLTGSQTLTNKTLTSPIVNTATVKSPREITTVSATAATGTINFDVLTQSVLYYTTNASATWVLNIRGDGSTSLNTVMATGDAQTIVFIAAQGTTAYYPTSLTIDGTTVTPKWQGGTAPTAGNASSTDAYTYSIIKTGSAAYTVLASQTKFA